MRGLIAVPASLALLLVLGPPVMASCRPPAPVAENAGHAVAVVYGTVTSASGETVTLRVDRALKGSVGRTLVAFVGPGRGGAGGTAVATSVDYAAKVGSDHVLYLVRGEDGQLETNACIGSHAGPPNPDELAYFGAGTASLDPTPPAESPPEVVSASARLDPIWPALIIVLVGAVLAFILGMRVVGPRKGLREKHG